MKKTAKYYASHPEARDKKKKYDTEYHATPERKKYRADLGKANRKAGSVVGDGQDMSHTKSGSVVKEKASTNRARQGANKKSTKK